MKPHVFHPAADAEYTEAARHYAEISAELGGRFFDEIETLVAEVRTGPGRFRAFDPPARRHLA